MKHTIRFILIFLVLVIGNGHVRAITDDDVIINIQPNNTAGTATKSVSGMTVTITATPATGYSIDKDHIIAEKMINAMAPRRSSPSLASSLPITDNGGNSFSFTIPDGYTGAFVTVNFYETTANGITSLDQITDMSGTYVLTADVDAAGFTSKGEFKGTLDGGLHKIYNLSEPLFSSTDGAKIRNITFEEVNISESGNVGAVTREAKGASRIYNIGILSGSVGGTGYTGGLVGLLDGTSRVINCYSYATITGGTDVGGIVGYNNGTTTASSIKTMVMNCMFYGDIIAGDNVSPVYGGNNINNLQGGLNTYNYYAYEKLKTKAITEGKYNCALAVEEKYLNRFEFYRLLLNSNKKLAAYYATGSTSNGNQMAKWVLETADRSISGHSPYPYPILKAQGYYPSIINYDAENAPDSSFVGRNKGGKLGKTLSVTISGTKTDGGQSWPTGASITTSSLTLQRTDKDFDRFNFNYDKVQLPYYSEVGTGNYTGNRVVTGWKIISITTINGDPYTSDNYDYDKKYSDNPEYFDYPNYNFANRKSSNKDLYSVSGRVFSQGAYFDVPYGVTSITIEPYWGKACYIADSKYDVVYKIDYTGKQNTSSTQVSTGATFNGEASQVIKTSVSDALSYITSTLGGFGPTVYDNAVVLVGNLHLDGVPSKDENPFTMMSVDMDNDKEPDFSLIYHHKNRTNICPIRFDFLAVPGTAQAQKPNGASLICNFTIFKTRGWLEATNTSLFYTSQLEYENGDLGKDADENAITKIDAPLILLGGVIDQFVSTQSSTVTGKTIYIHVGSNVWINSFGLGTHSDGKQSTPHVPVSVTGGDFKEFYLTGTYNANSYVKDDNAECYISGGRFGEVAGAALEQIGNDNTTKGNVHWQIYNADITRFFGGGINDAKPVKGNIITDIFNSHVDLFCGGPKFGNMYKKNDSDPGKTVTTTAEGCTFGKYFGAGYGGNSINKKKYYDKDGTPNWTTLQGYYTTDKGKYFDGATTGSSQTSGKDYGKKGPGVATDFDYEYFVWSSGATGVRLFVKFTSFSTAQCNDVSSTLKKCTVETNFYGGGNLGKVIGTATSKLEDCTVKGNVYGAGYSASLPTVEVRNAGFDKDPNYNSASGMFEPGKFSGTTTFSWQKATADLKDGESGSNLDSLFIYTNVTLDHLGEVKNTNLTIKGSTTVGESVYGGGEESGVGGNTEVIVNGGRIGVENTGTFGYRWGNVYGGGKGKIDDRTAKLTVKTKEDLDAGLVKGNTNIEINGGTILHNVYGGGAVGSVGTFTRDANGMPTACNDTTGLATVTINGGIIGHDHMDTGMVNGSSRGWEGDPRGEGAFAFLNQLAWVNNANVTIGNVSTDPQEDAGPTIYGSVYGGGENGHNLGNGAVTVYKGTIGYEQGTWDCGNLYGAGCGTDTFWRDDNGNGEVDEGEDKHRNPMAGIVCDSTFVTIKGGHVIRNVYGAGSMGSVGKYTYDENGLPTICAAKTGNTIIDIRGGVIGKEGTDYGHVFGGPKGSLTETEFSASVRETLVNIDSVANVKGSVFGGGEAGIVKEGVVVKMNGGDVYKDVYGGGAKADTQTSNWDVTANENEGGWADADEKSALHTTTVRLTGGTIHGEAYGGGLGEPDKPAYVYGDVLLDLNGTTSSGETGAPIDNDARGCAVNEVFGCNNVNGTPKGNVLVHVYATQNKNKSQIANTDGDPVKDAKMKGSYDVLAVYGGGNLSAYEPVGVFSSDSTTKANATTNVIIDGCGLTSIQYVYGGGNAASTPATKVTVNGTFEIEELFGGGNGKDSIVISNVKYANPGANVGFYAYADDASDAQTPADRSKYYGYGSGKASVNVFGGTIHRVFGGSNTKGNVRQTALTLLDENSDCEFCVDEAYGGGKSAPMDAEAKLLMACIPGLQAAYGGAEAAAIKGNVTLNITNGTFNRVFGGNNLSGTIDGAITVNIAEVGCRPIIIGELYGGGNQAAYSVYGYKNTGTEEEPVYEIRRTNTDGTAAFTPTNPYSATQYFADPQVNVMSFTSIGSIYGGGYGDGATMVGSPTVNVNEVVGTPKTYPTTGDFDSNGYKGKDITIDGHLVTLPAHTKTKIGAISNVFGGGNAAQVIGNTNVNIGTLGDVFVVVYDKNITVGTTDVSSYYVRSGSGTLDDPYDYDKATGTAEEGVTYYEKKAVVGVDIRGNVYGGGNNAEVTGNTNVNIGKKEEGE